MKLRLLVKELGVVVMMKGKSIFRLKVQVLGALSSSVWRGSRACKTLSACLTAFESSHQWLADQLIVGQT